MKSETIRIPGVHYTLKQLLDMDRVPVPGNPGETRWNNRYCQVETTYWNIADTVVDPERVKEERERLRLERNARDRKRYAEKKAAEQARREKEQERIAAIERLNTYVKKCWAVSAEPIKNETGIVSVAVETTGLDGYDELLRVAAVDGEERLMIDILIKPRYIDYWRDAYEVNQISRADVADAPYLADVAAKIKGILLSGHVIAYNSWFTEAYLDVPGVEIDGVKEHIDGYTGLAEISEQYGIPYSSVNTVDKAIATLRVYKTIST